MFKKYDAVYIRHNTYTDVRKIGGKVGYVLDIAKDMFTVRIPHSTGFEAEYVLYENELENLDTVSVQTPVEPRDHTEKSQDYWQGFKDGLAVVLKKEPNQ